MSHVCPACGRRYEAGGFCGDDGAALADATDPLLGTTVGRWRLARVLGEGGMGRVYLAVQPAIGSRVAIKVLSEACARDRELVDRFFAEARAVGVIRHEHIITVLDLARLDDGRPYIVMEYVEGETLGALARRAPLPLGTLSLVVGEVLSALAAAHAAGVIHRDLKPDNVLVTASGHAKVLDFGIAKLAPGLRSGDSPRTATGALLGTPDYMAPEQVAGGAIDGRADLYATGALLFEAATGRRPFQGETLFALLRAHVEAPVPSARGLRGDIPEALDAVIARAMAKRPDDRFASADEMAETLAAACASLPPAAWAPLSGRPSGVRAVPRASDPPPLALAPTDAIAPTARTRPARAGKVAIALGAAALAAAVTVVALRGGGGGGGGGASEAPAVASGPVDGGGTGAGGGNGGGDGDGTGDGTGDGDGDGTGGGDGDGTGGGVGDGTGDGGGGGDGDGARRGTAAPVSGRPPPPSPPAASEQPPAPAPRAPDAGASGVTLDGVTLVETGGGPGAITAKPDYDARRFDALAWLPRAEALAKRLAADARLIEFDVDGVGLDGRANLTLSTDFDASYEFRSPAASKRPAGVPKNVPVELPCKVYVTASAREVEAWIVEDEACDQPLRPRPRCTLAQVWQKAADAGAPTADVVAQIDYLWDGWFIQVGDAFTSSLPDDC